MWSPFSSGPYGEHGKAYNLPAVGNIPLGPTIERAIDLRVDQASALTQITVLVIAALGAMIFKRAEEGRLASGLTVAAGVAALVLGGSILCGSAYADGLVEALRAGGVTATAADATATPELGNSDVPTEIPDVFDEKFDTLRKLQLQLLMVGLAIAPFMVRPMGSTQ